MDGKALGAEIRHEVLRCPVVHGQFDIMVVVHARREVVLRKGVVSVEWVPPSLLFAPVPLVHPLLVKAIPMSHLALPKTQL